MPNPQVQDNSKEIHLSFKLNTVIITFLVILIGAVLFFAGMYLGNIKATKSMRQNTIPTVMPTLNKLPSATPTPTTFEEQTYQQQQYNSDTPPYEVPYGDENFDTDQQYQDAMQ